MFNYERFDQLSKERGLSKTFLYEKVGKPADYSSNLKRIKKVDPALIQTWADLLGTTPAYLNGETDEKEKPNSPTASQAATPKLTVDEQYLLDTYRNWCHTYEDHRRLLNVCDQLRAENALRNETTV